MTRKKLSPQKQMDIRAMRILAEEPEPFEFEDANGQKKIYKLYPLQLGRLALITERLIKLDMCFDNSDDDTNIVNVMWEICSTKPRQVAEIIAISTLRTKEEIDALLEERTNELLWSPTMTPIGLSKLLYTIIFQSYYEDFMRAIRLVKILSVNISQKDREERIAMVEEVFGDRKML